MKLNEWVGVFTASNEELDFLGNKLAVVISFVFRDNSPQDTGMQLTEGSCVISSHVTTSHPTTGLDDFSLSLSTICYVQFKSYWNNMKACFQL